MKLRLGYFALERFGGRKTSGDRGNRLRRATGSAARGEGPNFARGVLTSPSEKG